jgi:dTDP-4-dehydrorhamnose reductase
MHIKLLVTGGNGQLAQEIKAESRSLPYDIRFASRKDLDVTSQEQVRSYLGDYQFTHVINAAAYTKVDKAEEEALLAWEVNVAGARNLANACRRLKTSLLHVSTDFVFDGCKESPYLETDIPNPLGVYGRTKFYGEESVRAQDPNALVIRTSWLYSSHGHNFVKTILRLAEEKEEIRVVADQTGTPTYARDLARCLLILLPVDRKGVNLLHYTNEGSTSWYGFAEAIIEIIGAKTKVTPITTKDYPTPARRPSYSVLNRDQIKRLLGENIPHWKNSLRECLAKI